MDNSRFTCSDVYTKLKDFVLIFYVLSLLVISTSGFQFEKSSPYPGYMDDLSGTVTNLSDEVHQYLENLVGAQTIKAVKKVLWTVAEGIACGLTVLSQCLTQLLGAAGLDVDVHLDAVTPEGVVYIGQWILLALIGYWLLSMVLRLVASTLRRVMWLLKLVVVLGLFGLILGDRTAATETTAMRLAGLVCFCALLGIGQQGSSGSSSALEKTARLEDQVRSLERRVREMERRRREE